MRIMRPRVCMLILGMSLILPTGVMQGQTINHKLEPYLKSGNLPAVAAAVVDRGVLTEYGRNAEDGGGYSGHHS